MTICKDFRVFSPQSDGVAVGFISVTTDVDLKQLHDNFDLSEFGGLYKLQQIKQEEAAAQSDSREDETETPDSKQVT